ncbi:hypothetical protein LUZ60_015833 [Juncus effusus]|nr:hypothetical protein LUZ60_015833 [Juncus effusus]
MQQKKRKPHRGSLSKKDNNNNNYNYNYNNKNQSFFSGSGFLNSAAPDPLISSFISNLSVKSEPSDQKQVVLEPFVAKAVKRVEPSIPAEEQQEISRRSQFVRGLLLSTVFDEHDFL